MVTMAVMTSMIVLVKIIWISVRWFIMKKVVQIGRNELLSVPKGKWFQFQCSDVDGGNSALVKLKLIEKGQSLKCGLFCCCADCKGMKEFMPLSKFSLDSIKHPYCYAMGVDGLILNFWFDDDDDFLKIYIDRDVDFKIIN